MEDAQLTNLSAHNLLAQNGSRPFAIIVGLCNVICVKNKIFSGCHYRHIIYHGLFDKINMGSDQNMSVTSTDTFHQPTHIVGAVVAARDLFIQDFAFWGGW